MDLTSKTCVRRFFRFKGFSAVDHEIVLGKLDLYHKRGTNTSLKQTWDNTSLAQTWDKYIADTDVGQIRR